MKAIAFVPVRLSSSRLPRKHLRKIGERTLLSWVIKRLKDAKQVDQIVICSPDEQESNELAPICVEEKVEFYIYKGSSDDMVGRLCSAAQHYSADICVLASGDCPLLSSTSIDKLVSELRSNANVDMVSFAQRKKSVPIHEGILVSRYSVWENAEKVSDTVELREHFFPILQQKRPDIANPKSSHITDDEVFYKLKHRISVDTPADLAFQRGLYTLLNEHKLPFRLDTAIEVMLTHPQLLEMNASVYQKVISDKTIKIVFIVKAELRNALHIASRLVHQKGYGVEFLVFDAFSQKYIQDNDYHAVIVTPESIQEPLTSKPYAIAVFDEGAETLVSHANMRQIECTGLKVKTLHSLLEDA